MGVISANLFIIGRCKLCRKEIRLKNGNGVLNMIGYLIVKLEADAFAAKEGILQRFNSYIHQATHMPSFVHRKEGYFRFPYTDEIGISSAGIVEFGKFLQSTGYIVTGISSKETADGKNSTEISFTNGGTEAHVLVSTLNASSLPFE